MPFLASLIAMLFGQIFEYFTKYMTRKLAFYAALVAACTALTAGLFAAFTAILAGIKVGTPDSVSTLFAFIPSNGTACAAAYASAAALKWAYDWNTGFLQKNLFL